MGGLTAGREKRRGGAAVTSLHTFLHTQYGYVLYGLSVKEQAKVWFR